MSELKRPIDETLATERATTELGARLLGPLAEIAHGQSSGALLVLTGPLGAGKSSLARGLLRAAGVAGALPSPTFTLLEPYELPGLSVYHLDLYRLADRDELLLLGWDALRRRGSLCIVEWGESVAGTSDLHLHLDYVGDGDGRRCLERTEGSRQTAV